MVETSAASSSTASLDGVISDNASSGAASSDSVSDPGLRPLPELEAQITELAGHLNAANHRWLMLIAEFDRREGWADGSSPSCAHWLGWKCGIDLGAARERVRVARALERLPLISAAMARGALSYSKVRALTRVATPENEEALLMIALHGTARQVEKTVRLYRRAHEACMLEREAVQFANRGVIWFHDDDDGSLVMRVRLPAESGAIVIKAFDLATDELRRLSQSPNAPVETDQAPTRTQLRADVFPMLAETWLSHGFQSLGGGDRQHVVVHVDQETLQEAAPGRCEIEDGPSIAVETAHRLSCDASLVTIVEDESGAPLDVGRKTRSIPPDGRRALQSRDAGCRFPGCTHTRFLDGHHIRHWANGGETKLSNLVMLCRFHHRQVHEGRVKVRMLDDGALRFTGRRGQVFEPAVAMAGSTSELVRGNLVDGHDIGPATTMTRCCGRRMGHELAMGALLDQLVAQGSDVGATGDWPDGNPASEESATESRAIEGSAIEGSAIEGRAIEDLLAVSAESSTPDIEPPGELPVPGPREPPTGGSCATATGTAARDRHTRQRTEPGTCRTTGPAAALPPLPGPGG